MINTMNTKEEIIKLEIFQDMTRIMHEIKLYTYTFSHALCLLEEIKEKNKWLDLIKEKKTITMIIEKKVEYLLQK